MFFADVSIIFESRKEIFLSLSLLRGCIEKIMKNEIKIFADFFRYDVIQERAWFRAILTPIFKKIFFTSKHNMKMANSEKLLKKPKKIFSGILFDMTSSKKGRGSGLS